MYKLLIADDEALEREGLEMMIRRMLPEQFEFIHAENGRRAIQLAEERRPDFIFMDIKMPGIPGLEAVREIRQRIPGARVVLVTAHDFFAYAREAVALGVKDYVLKPAKRDEMLELLKRLMEEHQEERRKRGEELELRERLSQLLPLVENEFTLMLMTDSIQDVELEQLKKLSRLPWEAGYVMVLVLAFPEPDDWDRFQAARRELYEGVKVYIKSQLPCMVSPLLGNRLAVMIPATPQAAGFVHRIESVQWAERLQEYTETRHGVTSVIGIGPVLRGMEGLRRSYQAAVAAAASPSEFARIRHSEDVREENGTTGIALAEEQKLVDALRRHNKEEARYRFARLLEQLTEAPMDDANGCRNELAALFLSVTRQLSLPTPGDWSTLFAAAPDTQTLRQTASGLLEKLLSELSADQALRQSHVVERAKAYIGERYKTEISMEQTAEYVNLSSYYFSKLFKAHTGETFMDYVTRLRIEEAKQLLETEGLSFKEICYEVGYNDPNYFSRIFKKTTGLTPTEYRQQALEGSCG